MVIPVTVSETPIHIPRELPQPESAPDLLVIAGEHSGDEHGASMVRDLLAADPGLRICAIGGRHLSLAGAQLIHDLTAVSVVGFVEVLRHYGYFRSLFDRVFAWIEEHRPRHICFIDYPGFNLRLAKQLCDRGLARKGGGEIGLWYYIGPQVWAWKAGRRFPMAETLDGLGVIFPFEVECYGDTGLPVVFVGHPFVQPEAHNTVSYDPDGPLLLLPGSRQQAVSRIFPAMAWAFAELLSDFPDLETAVVYPSDTVREPIEAIIDASSVPSGKFRLVPNDEGVSGRAVLTSSGTMSLRCALAGVPGAICYRAHPMTYWMARYLLSVKFIGIANILLGAELYPEFIQTRADPEVLAGYLATVLADERKRAEALDGANRLRELLRPGENPTPATWLAGAMSGDPV